MHGPMNVKKTAFNIN